MDDAAPAKETDKAMKQPERAMTNAPRAPADARSGGRSKPFAAARVARRLHGYVGLLIAPSVLFFAATGAVQLFSLHEAHGGYTPPSLLVTLASLHKDQVLSHPRRKPDGPPAPGRSEAKPKHREQEPGLSTWMLKWTFLAVAIGLILSTGLGLWMAFQDRRRVALNAVLLAIGVLVPLLLALS